MQQKWPDNCTVDENHRTKKSYVQKVPKFSIFAAAH